MRDELDNGRLADEIISNPVYQEAYELIEQEIFSQWKLSKDKAERECLHQTSQLLHRLKVSLNQTMLNGKVELKVWQKKNMLEKLFKD